MRRLNSPAGCLNTGMATLDLGDGLTTELPLGKSFIVREIAGRTISIWDYLNNREQMIYGETGSRDISSQCENLASGTIEVSREGNRVYYKLYAVIATDPTQPIKLGARFARGNGFYNSEKQWLRVIPMGASYLTHKQMSNVGSEISLTSPSGSSGCSTSFNHPTVDPWPTTLPGVAA